MATSATLRISRLRALIEHPNTGDGERATAQRMLDRILTKTGTETPVGDRTYGNRHHRVGRHADLERIADMIRADIVLARATFAPRPAHPGEPALRDPIGDAPPQITFTVDTPHHSCIDITIDNVPPEWGWVREDGIDVISPALQALADELADLMNGYNHDGSDIDKRFFGRVRIPDLTLVW